MYPAASYGQSTFPWLQDAAQNHPTLWPEAARFSITFIAQHSRRHAKWKPAVADWDLRKGVSPLRRGGGAAHPTGGGYETIPATVQREQAHVSTTKSSSGGREQ